MKIINEKGKLFGIINVVDLLVLVAALSVVLGVGYKLFKNNVTDVTSPMTDLTMVVRVRGAMPYLVEELERNSPVGKQMVAGNDYVDGDIVDMQFEDYVQYIATDDGHIVEAVDGVRKDIIFTIKAEVKRDAPVNKIGSQEVRAGRTFTVKTNDFEINGSITSLDIENNNNDENNENDDND